MITQHQLTIYTKVLSIILFNLFCASSGARNLDTFEFLHLNSAHGLSNNQVTAIFKDSRSFMWFGTNGGLNRYDGAHFKVYQPALYSPAWNNKIEDIQEDAEGNLWLYLGSSKYVVFDFAQEKFILNVDSLVQHKYQLPSRFSLIRFDTARNAYIYYPDQGIYAINAHTKTSTFYPQNKQENTLSLGALASIQVTSEHIWVLQQSGLVERINKNTGEIDFRNAFFANNAQNTSINKTLFIDTDHTPWVYPALLDEGTAFFDFNTSQWVELGKDKEIKLSANFVCGLAEDQSGLVWIATDHGGINLFDKTKRQIAGILVNNILNKQSISQNSAISIYPDNKGIMWIGTYKNGISYYHHNLFLFKKPPLYYQFINDPERWDCNTFCRQNTQLWIGTNGRGLVQYDEQSKQFRLFQHRMGQAQSISSNIVTCLLLDHQQTLWIGTFLGGLNAYNGKQFVHYQVDGNNSNALSNKSIYAMTEDRKGNLWLATLGGGIDQLNTTRNVFRNWNQANAPQLLSNYVRSMYKDPDDLIYLGTAAGLNVLKATSDPLQIENYFNPLDKIIPLSGINNNIIDSRGICWIATNNGLFAYHPSMKPQAITITTADGLKSNEVQSIIEDNEGDIWVGTHGGLLRISCALQDNSLHYSLTHFGEEDGLVGDIFNPQAIYKDPQGDIYVGTTSGYNQFNPRDIKSDTLQSLPKFTELRINNEWMVPNGPYNKRVILTKPIGETQQLALRHNENSFSLRFSSFNYLRSQRNKYRFMLEGLDRQWTEISDGKNEIAYTNLAPGTYKLLIYSASSNARNNLWTSTPLELIITIDTPLWFTWWAYLLYILLILIGVWIVVLRILRKQQRQFEQDKALLEINKALELDELKIKFFTNISHEFKTPLTLIMAPVEKLLKDLHHFLSSLDTHSSIPIPELRQQTEQQQSLLEIVQRNAFNLLEMLNEILDFRKIDAHKMQLHLSSGDVVEYTQQVCQSFYLLASQKEIQFQFTTTIETLVMEFDSDKYKAIVSNLISNAFKFTPINGTITVHLDIEAQTTAKVLCIKVTDSGIGMERAELHKIFDCFYQVQSGQQPGTGVGLYLVSEYVKLHEGQVKVESEVGQGTQFTISLPIRSTLAPNEIMELNTTDKPLLLIVDDNSEFRQFAATLFHQAYHVITAADGESALQLILEQLPDLILCDVMMPQMDGYELCKTIKEDIRISHIPIILLSAKGSDESRYMGIDAGANDYITKPFNIDLLQLKIAKIIERQSKHQAQFQQKIAIATKPIDIQNLDDQFMQKVIAIVEKRMSDPLFTVDELGREMAISRIYFYKKMLTLTSKSPSEFIRLLRMQRSAYLLENSQLFVNEIAYQVGFNDVKYFRKHFKEEYKMTPNEYKASIVIKNT